MMFRSIVTIFLAFTFNAGWVDAQTFRGAIQGASKDSSGFAIMGAQVTVVGEETNLTR
jgi:hypothetical protein